MINWLKRKIAILSLALSNVEKNTLNNTGNSIDTDMGKHSRLTQGRLSDALINGEVTEQVQELRWRMYKILDHSNNFTTTIIGYDEDNLPITKTSLKTHKIKKLKVDGFDDYEPIMVIKNEPITISSCGLMDDLNLKEGSESISFDNMESQTIMEYPIDVERKDLTPFEIEKYSKKMVIRKIDEETHLLEFYVPVYPDEYNRKSVFFIAEIKKNLSKKTFSNITNIDKVRFITNKSIGVKDNLLFEYEIIAYDKLVEFNGFYVIKFKARLTDNCFDVTEKHLHEGLEEKYKNKEKK